MLAVGKIIWHLILGEKLSYSETFGHRKLVGDGTYGMVFENNSRLPLSKECVHEFTTTRSTIKTVQFGIVIRYPIKGFVFTEIRWHLVKRHELILNWTSSQLIRATWAAHTWSNCSAPRSYHRARWQRKSHNTSNMILWISQAGKLRK